MVPLSHSSTAWQLFWLASVDAHADHRWGADAQAPCTTSILAPRVASGVHGDRAQCCGRPRRPRDLATFDSSNFVLGIVGTRLFTLLPDYGHASSPLRSRNSPRPWIGLCRLRVDVQGWGCAFARSSNLLAPEFWRALPKARPPI